MLKHDMETPTYTLALRAIGSGCNSTILQSCYTAEMNNEYTDRDPFSQIRLM